MLQLPARPRAGHRAHREAGRARDAVQQHREGRQHGHERRRGTASQRVHQAAFDLDGRGGAQPPARPPGRRGALLAAEQGRRVGEALAPVVQPLARVSPRPGPSPRGVVGVRHGRRRGERPAAVEAGEVAGDDAQRTAVAHEVVADEQQPVLLRARPVDGQAQQRAGREVEPLPSGGHGQPSRRLLGGGVAGEVDHGERRVGRAEDHLAGLAAGVHEDRAQRLVPLGQARERLGQRAEVERP